MDIARPSQHRMVQMSRRIAAQRGVPVHTVEVGYLRDVMAGVIRTLHDLPMEDVRPVTSEMLVDWPLVHRGACRCSAFRRANVSLLALTDKPLDALYDIHRDDLTVIDIFIKALQSGLIDGDLTKHITEADTKRVWQAIFALQACEEDAIRY